MMKLFQRHIQNVQMIHRRRESLLQPLKQPQQISPDDGSNSDWSWPLGLNKIFGEKGLDVSPSS